MRLGYDVCDIILYSGTSTCGVVVAHGLRERLGGEQGVVAEGEEVNGHGGGGGGWRRGMDGWLFEVKVLIGCAMRMMNRERWEKWWW